MKRFRVGGAVRDRLLGRPVQDCDWVVTGATPEQMKKLGFRRVGRDFPVFLHPETREEHALARTERKSGPGYRGFQIQATPDTTLEEDLQRRDLTINAMAEHETGGLIDLYGGAEDLRRKLLRHISPAFAEDPLRVLRVARFAARLDFQVVPETMDLMKYLSSSGELAALAPERTWKETARALVEPHPARYFEVLEDCGALVRLFPPALGDPAGQRCLQRAAGRNLNLEQRFAVLCAGSSPQGGNREEELLNPMVRHYPLPRSCQELARLACRHAAKLLQSPPDAEAALNLLQAVDALRRPHRFQALLQTCPTLHEDRETAAGWETAAHAMQIEVKPVQAAGFSGKAMGIELLRRRAAAITAALATASAVASAPPATEPLPASDRTDPLHGRARGRAR